MVQFDEDGWFIKQKINMKIDHGDNNLYPDKENRTITLEYDKTKYMIHGHTTHKETIEGILQIIPFYRSNYKGKKFVEWYIKGSGALAIIGKLKKTNKETIIKILIPKKKGVNNELI